MTSPEQSITRKPVHELAAGDRIVIPVSAEIGGQKKVLFAAKIEAPVESVKVGWLKVKVRLSDGTRRRYRKGHPITIKG